MRKPRKKSSSRPQSSQSTALNQLLDQAKSEVKEEVQADQAKLKSLVLEPYACYTSTNRYIIVQAHNESHAIGRVEKEYNAVVTSCGKVV